MELHYRVHIDNDHRAILGLLMGGQVLLTIGLSHPDLFSYVRG